MVLLKGYLVLARGYLVFRGAIWPGAIWNDKSLTVQTVCSQFINRCYDDETNIRMDSESYSVTYTMHLDIEGQSEIAEWLRRPNWSGVLPSREKTGFQRPAPDFFQNDFIN